MISSRWFPFCAAVLAATCLQLHANGLPLQTPASLQRAVAEFLRVQTAGLPGEASYAIGAIDPRLSLPACPTPEVFLPAGARLWGAGQVGVRCASPSPWVIYVPVTVRVTGAYVVTARALPGGHVLGPGDLATSQGDLTQLPAGMLSDPVTALGKTLSAPLAGGQPLRQDLLRNPVVVQQGQTVKLVSSGTGFSVTAEGRALTHAAEGQVAQVRSPSGNTVSGIARAGGIVEVRY